MCSYEYLPGFQQGCEISNLNDSFHSGARVALATGLFFFTLLHLMMQYGSAFPLTSMTGRLYPRIKVTVRVIVGEAMGLILEIKLR